MRPRSNLLTAAGLAMSVLAAGGAVLAVESSVQASSLPEKTIDQIVRSSGSGTAPVRQVRAARPGKFTADSCKVATWPYIPEECLSRAKTADVKALK